MIWEIYRTVTNEKHLPKVQWACRLSSRTTPCIQQIKSSFNRNVLYLTRNLRSYDLHNLGILRCYIFFFYPVYLFCKQWPQCMTSQEVDWKSSKTFSSNTLLLPPKSSYWALHGAGHAGRAQNCKRLKTEIRWKGIGPAEALWQSLNRQWRKQGTRRGESKSAAGPGLPGTHRQLFLDCLLESHSSHFHQSFIHPFSLRREMTTHFPLSSENPHSQFCYNMGPGALCYLVTGLWIRTNTSLRVPLWPQTTGVNL